MDQSQRSLAVAAVSFLALGGCASQLPATPDLQGSLMLPNRNPSPEQKAQADAGKKPATTPDGAPTSCFPNPTDKAARDLCVQDFMTVIDAAYYQYEIDVNRHIGSLNAGLAIAQSAFSISGTASKGTSAKILNSLGTFSGDVKTAISDELLYKTTVQILMSTMEADRAKISAQIKINLQQPYDTYPMSEARDELVSYFYAGTITHALSEAHNNAAATAQNCKAANTTAKAGAKLNTKDKLMALTKSGASSSTTTSDQCDQISQAVKDSNK